MRGVMGRPSTRSFDRYDTREIQQKDKNHFIHPWAEFGAAEEGCLAIAESAGAYVYDTDGNRYLDGIAGMWCVNVGYANEEMVRARRISDHIPRK